MRGNCFARFLRQFYDMARLELRDKALCAAKPGSKDPRQYFPKWVRLLALLLLLGQSARQLKGALFTLLRRLSLLRRVLANRGAVVFFKGFDPASTR